MANPDADVERVAKAIRESGACFLMNMKEARLAAHAALEAMPEPEEPQAVEMGPDGRAYVIGIPDDSHDCDEMHCPSAAAHTLYVLPIEAMPKPRISVTEPLVKLALDEYADPKHDDSGDLVAMGCAITAFCRAAGIEISGE